MASVCSLPPSQPHAHVPSYYCHHHMLFTLLLYLLYPIQDLVAPLWLSWGKRSFWNWRLQSLSCRNIFSAACRIMCFLYSGPIQRQCVKQIVLSSVWCGLSSCLRCFSESELLVISFSFSVHSMLLFHSWSMLLIIFTWPLCVYVFSSFSLMSFPACFFFLVLFFGCCSVFFCSLCVVFRSLVLWSEFWSMCSRISRDSEVFL